MGFLVVILRALCVISECYPRIVPSFSSADGKTGTESLGGCASCSLSVPCSSFPRLKRIHCGAQKEVYNRDMKVLLEVGDVVWRWHEEEGGRRRENRSSEVRANLEKLGSPFNPIKMELFQNSQPLTKSILQLIDS